MVSEWMKNENIIEYIKHNDAQRMRLVRGVFCGDVTGTDEPCSL
jgi:hypothetical protein